MTDILYNHNTYIYNIKEKNWHEFIVKYTLMVTVNTNAKEYKLQVQKVL
jgi:hypothetical protein